MIKVVQKGDFKNTQKRLASMANLFQRMHLEKYGKEGVEALRSATPVDSGKTADSWYYEIEYGRDRVTISWNNSNIVNGCLIAIILQYGHGTRNGGYVAGRDYINPAIAPIFERMSREAWEEVRRI